MRTKTLWLFCSAIASIPVHGWAAEGSPSGINVGELAIVQSQTILYTAQAERAKAERSITGETNQDTPQFSGGTFPLNNLQPTTSAPIRSADPQQDLPVVKAVLGSGKRLRATLLYSSGFEVDADSSSRELPGGYRVATLTVDNVTLERGGKRFALGFSSHAPTSTSSVPPSMPGNTQPIPFLPGLIPGQR